MKNKKKILSVLVLLLIVLLCSLFYLYKVDKAEPKKYNKQEVNISTNEKIQVYNDFKTTLKDFENISSFENIEKIASGKANLYEIVPEEKKDEIFLFDTFSGEEFESLSFQAIMFINEAIKNKGTDFDKMDKKEQKALLTSLPLDKERGYAVLPLGIFSPYLTGYSVDMFLVDGKWKPMMMNSISQIKAADNMVSAMEKQGNK